MFERIEKEVSTLMHRFEASVPGIKEMNSKSFVVMIFAILSIGCSKSEPRGRSVFDGRYIAHATGGLDGARYLNSMESFTNSHKNGFKYFEIDFSRTSDNTIVAFHEGFERSFGLDDNFTHSEFMSNDFPCSRHPIDLEVLATLMIDYPDTYIVTDTKNDMGIVREIVHRLVSSGIERTRIIPQVYNESQIKEIEDLGLSNIIFTVYIMVETEPYFLWRKSLPGDAEYPYKRKKRKERFHADLNNIISRHPEISVVTMPKDLYDQSFSDLRKRGVNIFIHPIDNSDEWDNFREQGVDGIYTSFLIPYSNDKTPSKSDAESLDSVNR